MELSIYFFPRNIIRNFAGLATIPFWSNQVRMVMRYNAMCTNDEHRHLIDTKTYLCHVQYHVTDIVLTCLYAKVTLPMFWKWRHAGYIIGCTLKKPVGTVKVKREEDGVLGLAPRKMFKSTSSRTSESALLQHGRTLLLSFIIVL